jgi:hypothetical protein
LCIGLAVNIATALFIAPNTNAGGCMAQPPQRYEIETCNNCTFH